ncbi:MAG: hypothetical protein NVV63_07930 [Opitutus sp.]|nr:hypothetical protein [Opitutus sp.]
MSTSSPVPESFEETFCAQYGVPPELYGTTVLRLTLYPHARWLADMSPRSFLAPDRDFITCIGRLTRWRGFASEAHQFQHLPENRRFWRRSLRLRVSVGRMRVLFSEVMGGTAPARPLESSSREEIQSGDDSLAAD